MYSHSCRTEGAEVGKLQPRGGRVCTISCRFIISSPPIARCLVVSGSDWGDTMRSSYRWSSLGTDQIAIPAKHNRRSRGTNLWFPQRWFTPRNVSSHGRLSDASPVHLSNSCEREACHTRNSAPLDDMLRGSARLAHLGPQRVIRRLGEIRRGLVPSYIPPIGVVRPESVRVFLQRLHSCWPRVLQLIHLRSEKSLRWCFGHLVAKHIPSLPPGK